MAKEQVNMNQLEMNQEDMNKVQDTTETDAAWQRLMSALEQEPRNDYWEQAEFSAGAQRDFGTGFKADSGQTVFNEAKGSALNESKAARAEAEQEKARPEGLPAAKPRGRRSRTARKWTAVIAAAAVAAAVVITPAGNQALASILGQFRMEQVTEVNEKDMEQLFNSVFRAGTTEQEINRFGTFTVESGKEQGEMSVIEASAAAGVPALPESVTGEQQQIYMNPGNKLSLKMNVDEINKVMKQLGATKLFPASVDGKVIALETFPAVYYDIPMANKSVSGGLSVMRVPSVSVDDSVDMQEALDAIIQFPVLPQSIKASLQQSELLTTGQMPLPVVTQDGAQSEQITVGTTKVLMNTAIYSDSKQLEAVWVKGGVLYSYSVYLNQDLPQAEEQFRTKLQELVEA